MPFRKTISAVVLFFLLTWTITAACAPLPELHMPGCMKLAYRTMMVEHPRVHGMPSHKCCPPQMMLVVVCYRLHGKGDCDSLRSCTVIHDDDAISGTTRYHDGQARACATAHATRLLTDSPDPSGALWERAGLSYRTPVLAAKAELRI